jgi:hypothetical protein
MNRDRDDVPDPVAAGETRVLDERDAAIDRRVSILRPRPFGLAAGEFVVPDDFDEPLPEDVLRDFEE